MVHRAVKSADEVPLRNWDADDATLDALLKIYGGLKDRLEQAAMGR